MEIPAPRRTRRGRKRGAQLPTQDRLTTFLALCTKLPEPGAASIEFDRILPVDLRQPGRNDEPQKVHHPQEPVGSDKAVFHVRGFPSPDKFCFQFSIFPEKSSLFSIGKKRHVRLDQKRKTRKTKYDTYAPMKGSEPFRGIPDQWP